MTTENAESPRESLGAEIAGYPSGIGEFIAGELRRAAEIDSELPFEESEYRSRLGRLRKAMVDADLEVLIITAPDATAWLHGFTARVYSWHSGTYFPAVSATVVH